LDKEKRERKRLVTSWQEKMERNPEGRAKKKKLLWGGGRIKLPVVDSCKKTDQDTVYHVSPGTM